MAQPVISRILDLHLEFDDQLPAIEAFVRQCGSICREPDVLPARAVRKPVIVGNASHGYLHRSGYIGKPVIQPVGVHHL